MTPITATASFDITSKIGFQEVDNAYLLPSGQNSGPIPISRLSA